MLRFFLLILLVITSKFADAQLSKAQVEDLLTNGSKRDWQFRQYRKPLGQGCSGDGQLYTFLRSGKLQRKRCIGGHLEFMELTWQVVPLPNGAEGEWQLVLGEAIEIENGDYLQTMRLDLPLVRKNVAGQQMQWRVVPNCRLCRAQIVKLSSKN